MKLFRLTALLLTCVWCQAAVSYEIDTHGAISKYTYDKSVQISGESTSLYHDMGVEQWNQQENLDMPFGEVYYDVFNADVHERNVFKDYGGFIIENKLKVSPLSLRGWLMRGAIREDDVVADSVNNGPCNIRDDKNPQDDLYPNPPDRPLNHFYDPINDRGLNQVVIGEKATDWALGVENALGDPPVEDAGRRNHFTLLDAREAQYRALTGRKSSDPADPTYPVVADANKIGPGGTSVTKADRDAYWATMFRSLGDLLHMIQDMAQPQHTRNDSHLDECEPFKFLVNKSIYEEYVNSRALGDTYLLKNKIPVQTEPLIFDTEPSYPIPSFNDAVSYFTTRNKDSQIMDRRGMADYSNRGFFSAGTNLYQGPFPPKYDSPENNYPSYGQSTLSENWVHEPLKNHGQVVLLTNTVPDSLPNGQSVPDVPLTTYGIFDQFLEHRGFIKRYTLNRYNYDAMADLLIPRAVAYGAGLLDYFFRGRLAISLPPEGIYGVIDHTQPHALISGLPEKGASGGGGVFGFEKIILNVNNATPDIDGGLSPPFVQGIGAGTFRAVAHYRLNPCYTTDLSGEADGVVCNTNLITDPANEARIATSEAVAVSAFDNSGPNRIEFDFSAEPIPVNAVDLKIQVVYYGELGAEAQAIAVGMRDISEPSFYLIRNSSDYYSFNQMIYRTDDPTFISLASTAGIPAYVYAAYTTSPGTLTVGNAAGVVQTPAFDPGEFIRVAYLADYDPLGLVSYIAPVSGAAFTINPRQVSIDQNNALTIQFIGSVGDSNNRLYANSIYNMTHASWPNGSPYGDFTTMNNFPVPVDKPVTVCFPATACP